MEKDLADQITPPSSPGPATPERASDESSTARSEYGGTDAFNPKGSGLSRTFDVWHSHLNLRVSEGPESKALYYIVNSTFSPGTPDVTIHAGNDKTGPVIGAAKFSSMFSKSVSFGLGDPQGPAANDIVWESLSRSKGNLLSRAEWRFSVTLKGQRRTYTWRHTRDVGPEAIKYSMQNLQLVDDETREVMAVFANNGIKGWKKKGKLQFADRDGEGTEWEKVVLLTGLTLVEKLRRMARVSRTGGSHYGG